MSLKKLTAISTDRSLVGADCNIKEAINIISSSDIPQEKKESIVATLLFCLNMLDFENAKAEYASIKRQRKSGSRKTVSKT